MSFEFESSFFVQLLREHGAAPRRILVVGCGDGTEARHIARATGADVVGIDLLVDPRNSDGRALLIRADGRRMPFRDGGFDAIYCYHVLEHIPSPEAAVADIRRVTAPGGWAFFGTPNRARLVGYLGGRANALDKWRWNVTDWRMRLRGRWTNEQGAHAGFTARDLAALVSTAFPSIEDVSLLYYIAKYRRIEGAWRALHTIRMSRLVAPSVYVLARAGERTESA